MRPIPFNCRVLDYHDGEVVRRTIRAYRNSQARYWAAKFFRWEGHTLGAGERLTVHKQPKPEGEGA
jgi:hypothetical protein